MDEELKARWNRMLAQAQGFEASEKIEEARARARLALREIREELERTTDETARRQLSRFQHRAERFVQRYDALYDEWEREIHERQARWVEREDAEYHAPLPVPPPPALPER